MQVLGFADYRIQGERLARALGAPYAPIELHRFPDGESLLRLPPLSSKHIVLCRSLDRPNDKLIELLLACRTAREQGAERITLVAPYLCYMRQDIAFHPGEAVSQRIVGGFLGGLVDELITVDPHLHRIERLEQAVPGARCVTLSAAPLLSAFLQRRLQQPLLLGPDAESEQWVGAIAREAGLEYAVARKERQSDHTVSITLPPVDLHNREIVIVDDMISTGHTLLRTAQQLMQAGASALHCLVTHALFAESVEQALHGAGFQSIWSTDSISHPSNAIELAETLAAALRD